MGLELPSYGMRDEYNTYYTESARELCWSSLASLTWCYHVLCIELREMLESWTHDTHPMSQKWHVFAVWLLVSDSSLPCFHSGWCRIMIYSVKTLKSAPQIWQKKSFSFIKIMNNNHNTWPGMCRAFKWPLKDTQFKVQEIKIGTCHFYRKLGAC